MRGVTPLRAASVLLVIFCVLHTIGGMLAQKSLGVAADRVFEQMKSVHFTFNGADSTWYGFWFGFGLTVSAFLLLSAIMAWELDRVPSEHWPQLRLISWALVVSHAFNTVLAWQYFFAGPGVFGTVITLLLAVGTWKKLRGAAASAARPPSPQLER